jgi:hypothetical protein
MIHFWCTCTTLPIGPRSTRPKLIHMQCNDKWSHKTLRRTSRSHTTTVVGGPLSRGRQGMHRGNVTFIYATSNSTRWVPVRCDGSKKICMKRRNGTINITMIYKIRIVNIINITQIISKDRKRRNKYDDTLSPKYLQNIYQLTFSKIPNTILFHFSIISDLVCTRR